MAKKQLKNYVMTNFILLNKDDLREIFAEFAGKPTAEAPTEDKPKSIPFGEVRGYLAQKGVRLSNSTLYKLTSKNEIPFKRFGERKMIFGTDELDRWIEQRMCAKSNSIAEHATQSARRKMN